ncbi:MAG: hypothetical protein AAFN77_12880 [Planctomycetota bacterium]
MTSSPSSLDDPEVLLFQSSPFGNLDAIVQQNGETVYFFLNERVAKGRSPKFGMRACWVRNLVQGPLVFNVAALESGTPPVFPRTHVANREGLTAPDSESLRIVWFEEGNGAALLESTDEAEKLLAVIPPWSGENGFMGYADECVVENQFCAPLPAETSLQDRIERADQFWQSFSQQPTPFAEVQPNQLTRYREAMARSVSQTEPLGENQYFNINGDKFPPRGLVEFQVADQLVLLTVGLCMTPQPNVEMAVENPRMFRRIELGFTGSLTELDAATVERARTTLSSIAAIPWAQFSWLGPDHTCSFPGIVDECDTAILKTDGPIEIELAPFRDDPVTILWITPMAQSND